MNQFKQTTIKLTFLYSLIFFVFIWIFSLGFYLWVNNSFGEGYVNRINQIVEQSSPTTSNVAEFKDDTAVIAADVTLDNLRNIIIIVNVIALFVIPTIAFYLSRRSLKPLIESQISQQQFIANASHELRTPLAVIAGELELAAKQTRTVNEYKETIENTSKEVDRMTKLVRDLLLLAKITDGSVDGFTTNTVDLVQLARTLVEPYIIMASKKKIQISLISPEKIPINVKGELVSIAIGNLVDNAVKFSDAGSVIDVDVSSNTDLVTIRVSNKGLVVNPATAENVFNRFYQVDTNEAVGSGLGLAITKQIVELHYGTVSATFQDNLSIFTIHLPHQS